MPILADFIFVLVFALLAMVVLAATSAHYRAWPVAAWFFLLIFLGTRALAAWFEPIGVPVSGAYWVPFALTAVLLALIVAAVVAAAGGPARISHHGGLRGLRALFQRRVRPGLRSDEMRFGAE